MNRSCERMQCTPGLSISPRGESNAGKLLKPTSATNSIRRKVRSSGKNTAGRKVRVARPKMGIDITWVTERIGVGGGIWTAENMAAVARAGVTHIIDMQIEFDDTPLGSGMESRYVGIRWTMTLNRSRVQYSREEWILPWQRWKKMVRSSWCIARREYTERR